MRTRQVHKIQVYYLSVGSTSTNNWYQLGDFLTPGSTQRAHSLPQRVARLAASGDGASRSRVGACLHFMSPTPTACRYITSFHGDLRSCKCCGLGSLPRSRRRAEFAAMSRVFHYLTEQVGEKGEYDVVQNDKVAKRAEAE